MWIESDFVKAYLAGPTRYHYVLNAALALARHPGVLGIKVADELGYHDGTTPAQAAAVLRRAVADIHTAMPATKVLIDVVVPELGCLSWTAHATSEMRVCGATARGITPEPRSLRSMAMPRLESTSSTSARVCTTTAGMPLRAPHATTRCASAGRRRCGGGGAG